MACPSCGADERSGWGEEAPVDVGSADLGEDNFDYQDFLKREGLAESGGSGQGGGLPSISWQAVVAVLLLVALVCVFVLGGV